MAAHKYTSWGRTRRPKNIAGADGTAITLESAPTTSATAGYRTENQRYLHVNIVATGTTDSVIIYGFNYAAAKWGVLQVPVHGAATTFNAAYVTAEIEGSTTRKNFVIDISGIDRVAFVRDGTTDTFTIYAAGSTF